MTEEADPSTTSSVLPGTPQTEQAASTLLKLMPFAEWVGIRLTDASPESVVGTLDWAEERCTADGILHGGVLMTLADSVGGACAYLNLPPGAATSTIESKTNFFRGVNSGQITATGRPIHVGGRTIVVQTEIRDTNHKLVALILQTQAVLRND